MLKKILFILTLIALTPSAALAEMKGYLGTDGYFHIQGLEPNTKYTIDLGGMPIIRSGISNSCGILRIVASGTITASDRIEIKDEKSGSTYGFTNTNIPVKETARCDGTIKPEREIWADDKGTTYISGLSPSSAQTIRLLTSAPTRNIKANICGFLSFKLGEPRPKAIIIENQAFVLASAQSSGGIACRKGKLFVAYPNPVLVAAVNAVTWRSQNPISWSSSTQIASISGSGTSWSPPPSNPNPNPNPGGGGSCTIGVNCEEPPPPLPTCPTGTTGTPPNCVAPPPPPPPPEEPPKSQPPQGQKYCKVGVQMVVIGLQPRKRAYMLTPELDNYAEADVDDSGWVQFDSINYNDQWEGEPAPVEIGYLENDDFQPIGGAYSFPISVVQPCQ
ncbi:hypothetical protein GTQ43_36890 [Nostoc sp. KVJ3]|uniref:hypothetical protein n=1 Tax=Nostoc sp. KVJ3 TaxID=457945 RepID=UPI002237B412|nr:hypothetical protein [Nostoc sp. KVJ3]MCW5319014.1 hypothetical protein [Nostoc sp. KVJ3]